MICPTCGAVTDSFTDAYGGATVPVDGDANVCLYCGGLTVWHDGQFIEPTDEERTFLLAKQEVVDVIALIKLEGGGRGEV